MVTRLHKFLERKTREHHLFAWVKAVQYNLPSVPTQKAIAQFFHFHNITDWKLNSAENTFIRMNKEFLDSLKTTTDNGKNKQELGDQSIKRQ